MSDTAASASAPRTLSERIPWPDAARGLAIALVVFHHAIQFTGEAGLSEPVWGILTEFLRTMRMPLFFMAAGLFAGKWVLVAPWRDMLRSKVLLFVWVFAIWVLIRWGTFNLIPRQNEESGWLNLVLHFFIWPLGGWFILALAIFFVVAKATARVDPRIQLAVAALFALIWFGGEYFDNRAWDGLFMFYVFFIFGCYWRTWINARASALKWWSAGAIIVAWVIAGGVLGYLHLGDAPVIGFALRLLGLAAGVALAVMLSGIKPLRSLGTKTLPIYMVHSIIVFYAVSALVALGAPSWQGAGWWVPLAVAAFALVVSLGIGNLAPRVHAGWLFATPVWLTSLYNRLSNRTTAR
ncbi:acyltransferase family protein [Herbiconiux daphne]|uniref:Acyltransferase family protein n=1 Tax=Herbiconiux daphne TaxID=2970914 RepID=A0ABT2H6K7_9MICO|nr:acyltransferase family protein [Herbiconiux daphne]MCS5735586.1 acyltransferase family protein [Herbiconiux daphne]